MKAGFYWKIAQTNIRNNRKIYFPYILTATCMVMIFYIVGFLQGDSTIRTQIRGGASLQTVLYLGVYVIAIFSFIFLTYTSSFITKRRKREFGLFHVLGMDKKNIAHVMFWENTTVGIVSLAGGLLLGILLSKLVQAVLLQMLGVQEIPLDFRVNGSYILYTLLLFGCIFLWVFLDSLRQVAFSNAVNLLHASDTGEREPRANWVLALLGLLFLAAGYIMSQIVKQPLQAMMLFFIAVICVIIGTYGLFISGSVAIVKMLKKNKKYYYQPNHFISVSGMTWRMKRNGAGLASICILSTMVLVMISTTVCMYVGLETTSRVRYPMDIISTMYRVTDDSLPEYYAGMHAAIEKCGIRITREIAYYDYACILKMSASDIDMDAEVDEIADSLEGVVSMHFITQEEYNRATAAGLTLQKGEIGILLPDSLSYVGNTVDLKGKTYHVADVRNLKDSTFVFLGNADYLGIPQAAIILPEEADRTSLIFRVHKEEIERADTTLILSEEDFPAITEEMSYVHVPYRMGFDIQPNDEDTTLRVSYALHAWDSTYADQKDKLGMEAYENRIYEHNNSYLNDLAYNRGMFGGLLFLSILLGIVFMAGAVLIMYYKQVTEGYEDAGRYEIMTKVGMSHREIHRSVNAQVWIVFFAPLLAAGMHMIFAYHMIEKMLTLVVLSVGNSFWITTAVCFVLFALFYVAVYAITSKAYYKIICKGARASLGAS